MANHGRVAFETLGCKLNFSESSALLRGLTEAGYAKVAVEDRPDVVVVNTCSVTDHADAKCRNIVRRAKAANPDSYVAVLGLCPLAEGDRRHRRRGPRAGAQENSTWPDILSPEGPGRRPETTRGGGARGDPQCQRLPPRRERGDRTRPSSRCRMDVIISVPSVPFPSHGVAPALLTSPPPSWRPARPRRPGPGKSS